MDSIANIVSSDSVLDKVMAGIRSEACGNGGMLGVWQNVLYSIDNSIDGIGGIAHGMGKIDDTSDIANPGASQDGSKLVFHTKVEDLRGGTLFVTVDHPGWIQVLSMYKRYIVRSLRRALPELEINNIAATYGYEEMVPHVGNVPYVASPTVPPTIRTLHKANTRGNATSSRKLPDDICKMFDNMKEVLLTK